MENWTLVAGGITGAGGLVTAAVDPPHEVIEEIANTASTQRDSAAQRRLRAPQSTNASTGGNVKGGVWSGVGARRDSVEERMVTTTGMEVMVEVKVTEVGLTVHAVPTGSDVG
jgi:hypothetical protein